LLGAGSQRSGSKEADAFRIATEGQMRAGTFRGGAAKFTVKDAAVRFLEHCEGRRQRGERLTRQNYKTMDGHIGNYICRDPKRHDGKVRPSRLKDFDGGIGSMRLSQLTSRGVGDFRDRLRDAGVTVVTTRKILSTLQQLLAYAIDRDMIGINVGRGVKVIGRRDEGAPKIVPPTKEAMRALLTVADKDFRVKLAFASATGVRAGELHALRWRHLDLVNGEVTIETRVDAYGTRMSPRQPRVCEPFPCRSRSFLCSRNGRFERNAKRPTIWSFQTNVAGMSATTTW
jgi:integrase